MDYMERTKLLLSTASDRNEVRGRLGLNPVGRSSGESIICKIYNCIQQTYELLQLIVDRHNNLTIKPSKWRKKPMPSIGMLNKQF